MFFISTIKNLIHNRREAKKVRDISSSSLNRYFDIGEQIHSALLAAEEVMGSRELGLDEDSVKLSNDSFELTIKYKVDDKLTTYIHRTYEPSIKKRLHRKSQYFYTLSFSIENVFIKYLPDVYQKLAERTLTSIYERVKEYGHKADVNLANYMAEHFTDGVPNEEKDK